MEIVLLGIMLAVLFVSAVIVYMYYMRLWMRAQVANAPVSFAELFAMTRRGVSPYRIVSAYLLARRANLDVTLRALENHHAAGGDAAHVVKELIEATHAGRNADFEAACEEDLRNKGVLETARIS